MRFVFLSFSEFRSSLVWIPSWQRSIYHCFFVSNSLVHGLEIVLVCEIIVIFIYFYFHYQFFVFTSLLSILLTLSYVSESHLNKIDGEKQAQYSHVCS